MDKQDKTKHGSNRASGELRAQPQEGRLETALKRLAAADSHSGTKMADAVSAGKSKRDSRSK